MIIDMEKMLQKRALKKEAVAAEVKSTGECMDKLSRVLEFMQTQSFTQDDVLALIACVETGLDEEHYAQYLESRSNNYQQAQGKDFPEGR